MSPNPQAAQQSTNQPKTTSQTDSQNTGRDKQAFGQQQVNQQQGKPGFGPKDKAAQGEKDEWKSEGSCSTSDKAAKKDGNC